MEETAGSSLAGAIHRKRGSLKDNAGVPFELFVPILFQGTFAHGRKRIGEGIEDAVVVINGVHFNARDGAPIRPGLLMVHAVMTANINCLISGVDGCDASTFDTDGIQGWPSMTSANSISVFAYATIHNTAFPEVDMRVIGRAYPIKRDAP